MKEYTRAAEIWEEAIILGGEKEKIEKKIRETKEKESKVKSRK